MHTQKKKKKKKKEHQALECLIQTRSNGIIPELIEQSVEDHAQ